jgi:hypothetical protein
MANAEGGLILVGVTDQDREIVGVPREAMAYVADVLATRLQSPDWQPQMIEVALEEDKPGRYVLVLQVNRTQLPARCSSRGKVESSSRQSGCLVPRVRRRVTSCTPCSPRQGPGTRRMTNGISIGLTFRLWQGVWSPAGPRGIWQGSRN